MRVEGKWKEICHGNFVWVIHENEFICGRMICFKFCFHVLIKVEFVLGSAVVM